MIERIMNVMIFGAMVIIDIFIVIGAVITCIEGLWVLLPVYAIVLVLALCVTRLAWLDITEY